MKKIKYQGAITKAICEKKAAWHKAKFLKHSKDIIGKLSQQNKINFEVISFSGAASFEDQLLSVYSFIRYAGIPIKWTIYSDGSYTTEQKEHFKKLFSFVTVTDWSVFDCVSKHAELSDYLKLCHLAKKINIILGHKYNGQTIYADSDIVFYKHIGYYLKSALIKSGLWYAPTPLYEIDAFFSKDTDTFYPLNSGFLILDDQFDRRDVFDYFKSLKGHYDYFSEQSALDFAFRKQKANILDPREFVIDTTDQFDFTTKHAPVDIAMRHYVSPVRHKMWQNGWSWHFPNI